MSSKSGLHQWLARFFVALGRGIGGFFRNTRGLLGECRRLLWHGLCGLCRAVGKAVARRPLLRALCLLLAMLLLCGGMLGGSALIISAAVKDVTRARVMTVEELAATGETFDCILVLGCRVYDDGRMSHMLIDRVRTGISVYQAGISSTLLMSGDHRTDAYNEVGAMKAYAVEQGIPSDRVFLDHDGYSTYDSIARLRDVFGGRRVVIVTQEYHLYRALYLAEKLGLDAVGVPADLRSYSKQPMRELREVLARCKDVYFGLEQPDPEVLGAPVSLLGSGDATEAVRPIVK